MRNNHVLKSLVNHYQEQYMHLVGKEFQTNEKSSYGKGNIVGKILGFQDGLVVMKQRNGMPAFLSLDILEPVSVQYLQ